METAEQTASESIDTIEFGGLIWNREDPARIEYRTKMEGVGEFRIFQYQAGSYCEGKWLWDVSFNDLVDVDYRPESMELKSSWIVNTKEEAMQACLDAKNRLIDDLKRLSMALGIGNYATGFMDGQAALVNKIKLVLP